MIYTHHGQNKSKEAAGSAILQESSHSLNMTCVRPTLKMTQFKLERITKKIENIWRKQPESASVIIFKILLMGLWVYDLSYYSYSLILQGMGTSWSLRYLYATRFTWLPIRSYLALFYFRPTSGRIRMLLGFFQLRNNTLVNLDHYPQQSEPMWTSSGFFG